MNIAEILKYCPKGTKLYSPTWADVEFDRISEENFIIIKLCNDRYIRLFSNGYYSVSGECVIFPSKDRRDWSKFRLPTKPGDIMMMVDGSCPFITTNVFNKNAPICYCSIGSDGKLVVHHTWYNNFYIPASEEAKKELFDKIAEAGYKWNADTLELEKIESKFKEGDVVVHRNSDIILVSKAKDSRIISNAVLYTDGSFTIYDDGITYFDRDIRLASREERNKFYSALVGEGYKYDKRQHKLVKQEFKPFDKVLVRSNTDEDWTLSLFSHYSEKDKGYTFVCINGFYYNRYCIPYEGNEHLLGTTDSLT